MRGGCEAVVAGIVVVEELLLALGSSVCMVGPSARMYARRTQRDSFPFLFSYLSIVTLEDCIEF